MNDPQNAGVEVDIVEHRSVNAKGQDISNIAAFNMHWDGYQKDHKHIGSFGIPDKLVIPNNWHTYAVLWTPDSYTYFVDGRAKWTTKEPISQIPEEIRLTCEIQNHGWAGVIPANGYGALAQSHVGMDVDWVRIWQKAAP